MSALHTPREPAPQPVLLAPSRYVTVELAATLTGLSPGAIRTKIARAVWLERREYIRAPDGRVLIDMKGYERWVAQGTGSR